MIVRDMLGRELDVPDKPSRIVSLVPSQTELLFDLGLEEEVIGITKFCVHPEPWFRKKSRVGGTKTVHFDRVAALRPDLILANKEENVREQIDALNALAPVWVSDIKSLEEALVMIREVGRITGKAQIAMDLVTGIEEGFSGITTAVGREPRRSRGTCPTAAYAIWREPWMWAGGDTFISDLIGRIGWENVLADLDRYPEVSLEVLADLRPDKILLSSEPYPFKEKHLAEIQDALPDAEVILVDGEMFSWYGSRLLKSVDYFRTLFTTEK